MTTVVLTNTDFTLAAGQVMTFTNENAFALSASSTSDQPSLTIAGDLELTTTQGRPASGVQAVTTGFSSFYAASLVHVTSTGTLHVDASGTADEAYGYKSGGWGAHILNDGHIDVLARGNAVGLFQGLVQNDVIASVINHSSLHVSSSQGNATGVWMTSGNTLQNTGTIDVFAAGASIGVQFAQFDSNLVNSGIIRAHDSNPLADSVAVFFSSNVKSVFLNSGLLEGDYALKVIDSSSLASPSDLTFQNTGQMVGNVDLGPLGATFTNSGSIVGAINLGDGADLYDGRAGTETGLLQGGLGNDTELGGAGFDNLQGNQGDDSLSGAAGDDYVVGGKDNDSLFGDGGNDIVWGNLGNDTLDGGDGADQVRGGQGDDVVNGGPGDDFVSGDRGNDTITGGAGADLFHGSQDAGIDRVLDFHVAEGDRVMLDPGTTYTMSQVGADTVLDMGGGSQMILVGVSMSSLTASSIFFG
jgi:Ca2+-binding RTX toxin-like protein